MKTLALSTMAVFAMAAAAQAAVLIDMQFLANGYPGQSGAAVVGTAGDIWNHSYLSAGSIANLKTVDGTTNSGVSLSWSGAGADAYQGNNSFPASLMKNYIYATNDTPITLTLSGLTPGSFYDLYLYTDGATDSGGRQVTFTPVGLTTYTSQTTTIDPYILVYKEGTNYVRFSGLAPTVGGNLTITLSGTGIDPKREADFNGFQLQSVPEPGTWALLALTGTFFMVMRPRRRG